MLYSEFIENTGCKASEYNYQVYKNLEVMYMNSDISKEVIYEYGKKLVDNSKSQAVIEFEESITKKIEEKKKLIEDNKWSIEYFSTVGSILLIYCNFKLALSFSSSILAPIIVSQ